MTFSPFYMGNDTIPYEADGYVRSNNYGMQMSFMIPLDGSMIEQCKQIARRHEQTMRLQYELTRALKCTEIMKAGFTFRPGSRVEVICHDIVPIVVLTMPNKRSGRRLKDRMLHLLSKAKRLPVQRKATTYEKESGGSVQRTAQSGN